METKGITCKIPLDLHNRVSEEIRETESTISKFIEMVIMEHYEKGAGKPQKAPKPTRTRKYPITRNRKAGTMTATI